MTESDREKTKLSATGLNNLGIAFVTVGFLTPFVSYLYRVPLAPPIEYILGLSIIWFAVGFMLHSLARIILSDLDL